MSSFEHNPSAPRIEVRIEQLVLHGFAPGDWARIGPAMERELNRLLAEQGVPDGLIESRVVERLNGGSFQVPPGNSSEAIGAGIARAVFEGADR